MSEGKATPRPWSIAPCSDDYPTRDIVSEWRALPNGCESANWIASCDIQNEDESDPETNEANAALIVAAVNSYDAHLKAVEALRVLHDATYWVLHNWHGISRSGEDGVSHEEEAASQAALMDADKVAIAALAAVDEASR